MTEDEFLSSVHEICCRHGATDVVLFGSRARGSNAPGSDFDIAVYGVDGVGEIVCEIEELPTLYSADVIDMDACGSSILAREVARDGKPL